MDCDFHYGFSHDGARYCFGELRGIPFSFPCAFGRSNAVQSIMSQARVDYAEASRVYDRYEYLKDYIPVTHIGDYGNYLGDDLWKQRRKRALFRAGYRCARCGATRNLDVHHLTYARIGAEDEDDLVVLCRRCHAAEHGKEAD